MHHSWNQWRRGSLNALAVVAIDQVAAALTLSIPVTAYGQTPRTLDFRLGTQRADAVPCDAERRTDSTDRIYELIERTRASKRLFVLRRSDHAHFVDNVEQEHERMRTMPAAASGRICKKMRQIEELCSVEQAYFIRAPHHAFGCISASVPGRCPQGKSRSQDTQARTLHNRYIQSDGCRALAQLRNRVRPFWDEYNRPDTHQHKQCLSSQCTVHK